MRESIVRRVTMGFGLICVGACGLNPSAKKLDLAVGQYILTTNPWACAGGQNWPTVGTFVTLSHEGQDWVARSRSSADGNLELRFHEVTNSLVAGVALSGSLVGSGLEGRAGFTPSINAVSFAKSGGAGSAVMAAQSTPGVQNSIAGRVTGQVVFTDAQLSLPCSTAEVGLRPPVPCEFDATISCQ